MIYFGFSLRNPFHNTSTNWLMKDYLSYDKRVFANKAVSFQVSKFTNGVILDFDFRLSFRGQDHAGLLVDFTVLDYLVAFQFYDTRHWDQNENRWDT